MLCFMTLIWFFLASVMCVCLFRILIFIVCHVSWHFYCFSLFLSLCLCVLLSSGFFVFFGQYYFIEFFSFCWKNVFFFCSSYWIFLIFFRALCECLFDRQHSVFFLVNLYTHCRQLVCKLTLQNIMCIH